MRITVEILQKLARDTVARRTQTDHSIVAAFLYGSLQSGDPVLGGTADIDLFFVHLEEVENEREIVRMSDEVSLDIAHHHRLRYRQARELRRDPWLGPALYHCKPLFDPQHFLDFVQAGVRSQYHTAENILLRVHSLAESARQAWTSLSMQPPEDEVQRTLMYLDAANHAANAIASLSGPPLPVRRFLQQFPERAAAAGHPGFYPGLLGLLGGSELDPETLVAWLPGWRKTYEAAAAQNTPALHPYRLSYYLRGIEAIIASKRCQDALWPLLKTWTEAARLLPEGHECLAQWHSAVNFLGLSAASAGEKLEAMDLFLDSMEETLEAWAAKNGLSYQAL
jgi:hypothetical protein